MSLCVGAPAQGEDFYNRDQDQRRFWEMLQKNHVLLSAPRRLGKTSLLKKLIQDAGQHQFLGKHIDVSAKRSPKEVLEAILQHFPQASIQQHLQNLGQRAGQQLQRIQTVRVGLDGLELSLAQPPASAAWAQAAIQVIQHLSDQPLLIVLDEFSVFIQKLILQDRAEAEQFLQWLRAWRQETGLQCRLVLSGSISLNYLLQQHGLQAEINDCVDFELKAFSEQHAMGMLQQFAEREGWVVTRAHAKWICDEVGWLSPYYLLCVLEEAINHAYERLNTITPNGHALLDVDIQLAISMLKSQRSKFFHWYQRVGELLPSAQSDIAHRALSALSHQPQGLRLTSLMAKVYPQLQQGVDQDEQPFLQLLVWLVEQGYLTEDGQYWCFQSPILRQYWQHNHATR